MEETLVVVKSSIWIHKRLEKRVNVLTGQQLLVNVLLYVILIVNFTFSQTMCNARPFFNLLGAVTRRRSIEKARTF